MRASITHSPLAHPSLTSCHAAWFLTRHGLVLVCGPLVGDRRRRRYKISEGSLKPEQEQGGCSLLGSRRVPPFIHHTGTPRSSHLNLSLVDAPSSPQPLRSGDVSVPSVPCLQSLMPLALLCLAPWCVGASGPLGSHQCLVPTSLLPCDLLPFPPLLGPRAPGLDHMGPMTSLPPSAMGPHQAPSLLRPSPSPQGREGGSRSFPTTVGTSYQGLALHTLQGNYSRLYSLQIYSDASSSLE